MELYVATNGKDTWSGQLAEPNAGRTDGPLATMQGARDRIRNLKNAGRVWKMRDPQAYGAGLDGPVTVYLRGGRYAISQPIVFGPDDSYPVTYKAYAGETPVIDGGTRIENWQVQEVHGKTCWVADLNEVAGGKWDFRELFVDGQRAPRPRLPREGLYRMAAVPGMKLPATWGQGTFSKFACAPGEVKAFDNLGDVEVVYLHFWIEERSPIAAFDAASNMVTMSRPSRTVLVGSSGSQLADYYLDNVFEALEAPGQWYLDRPAGKLYYMPKAGQNPKTAEVYAPRCLQLLAIIGSPSAAKFVENVRFEGITLRHADWRHPSHDGAKIVGSSDGQSAAPSTKWFSRGESASASQAAADVPGVVTFYGARNCALIDCTIEHIGWYGVEIAEGCRNVRVVGNTIQDAGAGGIKINGAAARDNAPALLTAQHRITDNEIRQAGRVFHSAVGVLSMNAHDMVIAHNHIHDLFYTGISCGWEWGYHESTSYNNLIEKNHIHDIGQGLLSDMGGIYTLGVQPGTVLRGNLIHDIRSAHYGGWCIYPDEGSSHLLIEKNICYDADRQAFHQHYGRENVVRNNIFAFGGESAAIYTKHEPHRGFTMLNNIFVSDGKPAFLSQQTAEADAERMVSDLNVFWDIAGEVTFQVAKKQKMTLTQRQESGLDRHSIAADPKFRDVAKRDFRMAEDSPAFELGFEPIDLSDVGPRPVGKRD